MLPGSPLPLGIPEGLAIPIVSYRSKCNSLDEKSITYGNLLQKRMQFFTEVSAIGRIITEVDATGFNPSIHPCGYELSPINNARISHRAACP
jgi:hypothetical protein